MSPPHSAAVKSLSPETQGPEQSQDSGVPARWTLLAVLQIQVQMFSWSAFAGDPEQKVSPSARTVLHRLGTLQVEIPGASCRKELGAGLWVMRERRRGPLQETKDTGGSGVRG